MKKILFLFATLFFVASCGGLDDLISDLDEEEYECYHGNARLPFGTHPEYLVTPNGYKWKCDQGDVQLYSDGTSSITLGTWLYSELLDYSDDCGGHPSREQTGEWVVDVQGRLCWKYDKVQPGLYGCQRFTHSSGSLSLIGDIDYYEDGANIGSEYEPDTCTLEEE